jgi:hypothetical protein
VMKNTMMALKRSFSLLPPMGLTTFITACPY